MNLYKYLAVFLLIVGIVAAIHFDGVRTGETRCEARHQAAEIQQVKNEKPVADAIRGATNEDQRGHTQLVKEIARAPEPCVSTRMPDFALERLRYDGAGDARPAASGRPGGS